MESHKLLFPLPLSQPPSPSQVLCFVNLISKSQQESHTWSYTGLTYLSKWHHGDITKIQIRIQILKVFRTPNIYLAIVLALQIVLELTVTLTVNLKEEVNSPAKTFQLFKKSQYYERETTN